MNQKTHPGCSRVYARVLEEGELHTGDTVDVLDESAAERVARLQPPTIRWRPPGQDG